ncbi:hypothetical protein ES703_54003 [subsurface metagenome]
MALIRYGEGQQRSGSIGATVYSHNRYGAYIRARSIPVNPNSDRQVAVRNALRSLSIGWENVLTPEERAKWDEYASNVVWKNKFGDSVKLTGASHYIRSNLPYFLAFGTTIAKAPDIFNIATAELKLHVTAAESVQIIVVAFDDSADWASEDGAYQVVYMGLPQNPNIKFFGGPYRKIGVIAGNSTTPPTSNVEMPAAFPIAEGQRAWVRTRIGRADGRLSEFAQVNFLVSAS